MRFVPKLILALLACAALAPAAAHATSGPGAAVGHVRGALDTGATFPNYSLTANRHRYVILNAWQTDRLRALKLANPSVRVLVYKNLSFAAQVSASHVGPSPSGVSYAEAPDGWFLRNTAGQRFTSWSYSWNWAMDVGHPDYQARWASNVVSELTSAGWDGVFVDDTNASMKYHYSVSQVAKYPSDAAYGAATRSALAAIAPKVRAAGKLVVPNFALWGEYPAVYNDWVRFVDGALDEMFLKWGRSAGEGYRPESIWNTQIAAAKATTAQGKAYLAFTQSAAGDVRAARYGYASLLLATQGDASFAMTPDYTAETWFPEYDYDLGRPLAGESRDANGVHRRPFERGLVLVNPTGQTLQVNLGGSYTGSGLTAATTTTMPPQTGLILKSPVTAPPPPPPPEPEPEPTPTPEPEPTPTPEPEPTPTPDPVKPGRRKGQNKSATTLTTTTTTTATTATFSATATATRRGDVVVQWERGPRKAVRYRVLRNGRVVGVTRSLRLRDRTRRGSRSRYRIVAVARNGDVVARSRRIAVRA